MPSNPPVDWGARGVGQSRLLASPVERLTFQLNTPGSANAFTANATKTCQPIHVFDRAGVIREFWIATDAIPSDADGTMLLSVFNYDITEAAADTLVSSQDLETLVVAAKTGYQLTNATETSENEFTVEAGDILYTSTVSNSAAIDTNVQLTLVMLFQPLANL